MLPSCCHPPTTIVCVSVGVSERETEPQPSELEELEEAGGLPSPSKDRPLQQAKRIAHAELLLRYHLLFILSCSPVLDLCHIQLGERGTTHLALVPAPTPCFLCGAGWLLYLARSRLHEAIT